MRTYGRVYDEMGIPKWVEVSTDAQGFNDYVWITTLIQTLKLNLGESPFYANYGIPAKPSVVQQVAPDFYLARTQQQFSPFFASLVITRENPPATNVAKNPTPIYRVNITTHQGAKVQAVIAT